MLSFRNCPIYLFFPQLSLSVGHIDSDKLILNEEKLKTSKLQHIKTQCEGLNQMKEEWLSSQTCRHAFSWLLIKDLMFSNVSIWLLQRKMSDEGSDGGEWVWSLSLNHTEQVLRLCHFILGFYSYQQILSGGLLCIFGVFPIVLRLLLLVRRIFFW